jgi:hypothetical protein
MPGWITAVQSHARIAYDRPNHKHEKPQGTPPHSPKNTSGLDFAATMPSTAVSTAWTSSGKPLVASAATGKLMLDSKQVVANPRRFPLKSGGGHICARMRGQLRLHLCASHGGVRSFRATCRASSCTYRSPIIVINGSRVAPCVLLALLSGCSCRRDRCRLHFELSDAACAIRLNCKGCGDSIDLRVWN